MVDFDFLDFVVGRCRPTEREKNKHTCTCKRALPCRTPKQGKGIYWEETFTPLCRFHQSNRPTRSPRLIQMTQFPRAVGIGSADLHVRAQLEDQITEGVYLAR